MPAGVTRSLFRALVPQVGGKGQRALSETRIGSSSDRPRLHLQRPVRGFFRKPGAGVVCALVYEKVRSLDDFQPWLDQTVHFPEEIFDAAYKQVPPEWIEGEEEEFENLLERLLDRRLMVPELVSETRRAKSNPFPNWR